MNMNENVPLAPVATGVAAFVANAPGAPALVALHVETPTGTQVYFLPPDVADQLAGMLTAGASQARSGLIVPHGTFKAPPT